MNKDIIEGNWKEMKGDVQARWGKLTSDQLDVIAGNRKRLVGALQKQYGFAVEQAEKEIAEWERNSRAA